MPDVTPVTEHPIWVTPHQHVALRLAVSAARYRGDALQLHALQGLFDRCRPVPEPTT